MRFRINVEVVSKAGKRTVITREIEARDREEAEMGGQYEASMMMGYGYPIEYIRTLKLELIDGSTNIRR